MPEVTDQQYEVGCYPDYRTNQKFFAPKNQDAATILCTTNGKYDMGNTWAVPCNSQRECKDGRDEFGCEFSTWLIPSLLFGAGTMLYISLFIHLYTSIRIIWKKKMSNRLNRFSSQRPHISIERYESEKLYETAVLVESGDLKKLQKIYCQELENNGGEGEATCHLKVMGHSSEQKNPFIL